MQPALIHPKALEALRSFPKTARHELGEAILDMQHGAILSMPLSRPMPTVGLGVHELRVRDAAGIYRAFYVLKSQRGVLVFHAFEKKTQKTSKQDMKIGQKRLREML